MVGCISLCGNPHYMETVTLGPLILLEKRNHRLEANTRTSVQHTQKKQNKSIQMTTTSKIQIYLSKKTVNDRACQNCKGAQLLHTFEVAYSICHKR